MSWIYPNWTTNEMSVFPQNTDMDTFKITKVRDKWKCTECKSVINPKSWCFGKQYYKLCLGCGKKYFVRAKDSFKEIIKIIEQAENNYQENKEKYESENIISRL